MGHDTGHGGQVKVTGSVWDFSRPTPAFEFGLAGRPGEREEELAVG
jgi:hypothetical protein